VYLGWNLMVINHILLEYQNYKVIYRRYASLFFIVGVDESEVSF